MEDTMHRNRIRSTLLGFALLLVMFGCAKTPPTPITNSPGVETSLASTAQALARQTETARGDTPYSHCSSHSDLYPNSQNLAQWNNTPGTGGSKHIVCGS